LRIFFFFEKLNFQEEQLKEKFEAGDRERLEKVIHETLEWIEKNQLAEKAEFTAKQKEMEAVIHPIMTKVYQKAGGAAPEAGAGQMPTEEPDKKAATVEEVD
jgi:heat shock protein 1/8